MFLKVLSSYTCRSTHYREGQQIEVPESEGAALLADAPEVFKQLKKLEAPADQKAADKKAAADQKAADKLKGKADKAVHESEDLQK